MKADLKYFETFDGIRLYYEHWIPDNPCGLIVVVHGLGDHSGRYGPLVRYFFQKGFAVALYDQRGHGHSEGARGHCRQFQDFLQDLSIFVQKSREAILGVPLYLLGHSFGGQVVINFVVRYSKGVKGVIFSAPSFKIRLEIPRWKQKFAESFEKWFPRMKIGHEIDPALLTHNQDVVERYRNDPLILDKISLRLGREIMRNLEIIMPMASRLYIPCLFLHGAKDEICDPDGTRGFFRRVPIAQKELKIYPGMYHEILNELESDRVFDDIFLWINKQPATTAQIVERKVRGDLYEEGGFLNLGI